MFRMRAILAGLLALAALHGAAEAADPVYKFKVGGIDPPDAIISKATQRFADIVQQKTEGQVAIASFPAGQLGDDAQLLQNALQPNYRDMAVLSTPILTTADPATGVVILPFLFRDAKHVGAFETSKAAFDAWRDGLIKRKGIRMLGAWEYGFSNLYTRKSIATLAELKGLKIRVPPAADYVRLLKQLGANPTPVPKGELYMALQTGVIDGTTLGDDGILAAKLNEVTKFESHLDYMMPFDGPVIGEKFYQSLPPAIQAALTDAGNEVAVWIHQQIEQATAKNRQLLEASGMKIVEVTDLPTWKEAVQPIYADFEQKYGKDVIDLIRAVP